MNTTPAQDLTALADKLDERLEALEARLRNEADLEESMGFVSESIVSRNRLATVSEARATLTAALREAARMREALEKIASQGPATEPVYEGFTGNADDSRDYGYAAQAFYDAQIARAALKEESRG